MTETKYSFYNETGEEVEVDEKTTLAKVNNTSVKLKYKFYAEMFRGVLLDPNGPDYPRSRSKAEYKPVTESTFNNYLKYLQTGKTFHLRNAERDIVSQAG